MTWQSLFQAAWVSFFVCAVVGGCGEQTGEDGAAGRQQFAESCEMLRHFVQTHPNTTIVKFDQEDLNHDGRVDLVVMYRMSEEKNMMRVVLDLGGSYFETNEVPAPHSNQVIQFRDIDGKPPMEFIVQGMKGAKVGFAVFRIEENQLVDLFGEGMEDCC
ncbi:MAG: hypothetical protein HPY84_14160 [Syntrophobacteraceae bacterium]|nr:hypothetical protein [Syntrophobacteraceae bacterium]